MKKALFFFHFFEEDRVRLKAPPPDRPPALLARRLTPRGGVSKVLLRDGRVLTVLTEGLPHQVAALSKSRGRPRFAFFMEPRTGKTWCVLAEYEELRAAHIVDVLVVVAPNGVHRGWVQLQVPQHLGPSDSLLWTPSLYNTQRGQALMEAFLRPVVSLPRILAFNSEAFSRTQSPAVKFLQRVMKRHRVYLAVDESDWFATPGAKRGKSLSHWGHGATIKRILTGTPDAQGPLQYYGQFRILGNDLLGFEDYSVFKAEFSEWREQKLRPAPGRKRNTYPKLIRYRNLAQLREKMDPHTFFLKRADALKLPPPSRDIRYCEMTDEQRNLYREAKRRVLVELEGQEMTMLHAFTRLLRLRELTGGFFAPDNGPVVALKENTKIEGLLHELSKTPEEQAIVWCAFKHECRAVMMALTAAFRRPVAAVWGDIDEKERQAHVDAFQSGQARYFVGTAATAGQGRDLSAASRAFYFSNSSSVRQRLQSEDRSVGITQKFALTITDLVCPGTVDEIILSTIEGHRAMSDLFKGSVAELRRVLSEQTEGE